MTDKRDPYNILNQSRNASPVEIQRAYKRGSRALHPDKQQAKAVGVQQRNQEHTDEMDTIFLSDVDVQEAFVVLKEACKLSEKKGKKS
jgi:DnaJ-class molecular chaperone